MGRPAPAEAGTGRPGTGRVVRKDVRQAVCAPVALPASHCDQERS